MDAIAKARSLAVLESSVKGNYGQLSDRELVKICQRLSDGESWPNVFPGVASINITTDQDGPAFSLRLTKNKGTPVQLVKEGEGNGTVVAVKRVNELGFYNLGARELAVKLGLTPPRSRALIDHLGLRDDPGCFMEIRIGSVRHPRYSFNAIKKMEDALKVECMDKVWAEYRAKQKTAR